MENFLTVSYSINSYNSDADSPEFYIQEISGELFLENSEGDKKEKIGQILGKKINLENSIRFGFDVFELWDSQASHVFTIGDAIFDFKTKGFKATVQKKINNDAFMFNVLLVERIEIFEPFRGAEHGKYLLKNFFHNFIDSCALMVLKSFPLQLERLEVEIDKEEEIKQKQSLLNYYLKMGFIPVSKKHGNILLFDAVKTF